jgi:hypothetical protein
VVWLSFGMVACSSGAGAPTSNVMGTANGGNGGSGGSAGASNAPSGCVDADGDGVPKYCSFNAPTQLDCDDANPNAHPGATETCDGIDNDCNGTIDDGVGAPACPLSCEQIAGACDPAVQLATAENTLCYRTRSRLVYCLGDNGDGEAASLDLSWPHSPQPVPGVTGAVALVSDGASFFCAILPSDALCWGGGNVIPYHEPIVPNAVSYTVDADLGLCAITSDGAVACNSLNGQLTASGSPMSTSLVTTGATALDSFGGITCALLTGGAVQCWGYDSSGSKVDSEPVTSGATRLKVGPEKVCALVSGQLKCWSASLGSGFTGSGLLVPGEDTVTSLSLGADTECGMAVSGKVACWTGSAPSNPPSAEAISVGKDFGCLLTLDGLIQCWGAIDEHGAPALKPAGDATMTRSIPYLLPKQGQDTQPLLGTPPLGACDDSQDLASITFEALETGIINQVYTCATSCATALDPAGCVGPCYAMANQYAPLTNGCMACFANYFACTDANCYDTLNSCVGFPTYYGAARFSTPSDMSVDCSDCDTKKHAGEACMTSADCRSGACANAQGPIGLPLYHVCTFG